MRMVRGLDSWYITKPLKSLKPSHRDLHYRKISFPGYQRELLRRPPIIQGVGKPSYSGAHTTHGGARTFTKLHSRHGSSPAKLGLRWSHYLLRPTRRKPSGLAFTWRHHQGTRLHSHSQQPIQHAIERLTYVARLPHTYLGPDPPQPHAYHKTLTRLPLHNTPTRGSRHTPGQQQPKTTGLRTHSRGPPRRKPPVLGEPGLPTPPHANHAPPNGKTNTHPRNNHSSGGPDEHNHHHTPAAQQRPHDADCSPQPGPRERDTTPHTSSRHPLMQHETPFHKRGTFAQTQLETSTTTDAGETHAATPRPQKTAQQRAGNTHIPRLRAANPQHHDHAHRTAPPRQAECSLANQQS